MATDCELDSVSDCSQSGTEVLDPTSVSDTEGVEEMLRKPTLTAGPAVLGMNDDKRVSWDLSGSVR